MDHHDSRTAHSPEASTDERASLTTPCAAAEAPPPADARFASEAEERAYWAGVRIGMETAAASTAPAAAAPPPSDPPLLSDCLADYAGPLADAAEQCFPPGSRRPRHDGFTPERIGLFLETLAATGVVEHSARTAGISAQAAYAFRNRRQGRAFAMMWDAILVHRARARVESELQSRAIAGCVSVRKRDGVVVGEYHYYDNRLAMSLLTRLDRLAEREAPNDAHLRALSEEMEEFVDCLASGGDADAFVEERRPKEPEPEPQPRAQDRPEPPKDDDPELTTFARLSGCPDYLDVSPLDIEVRDIDISRKSEWSADQWVRAYRSGFMVWLSLPGDACDSPLGAGAAWEFFYMREASVAAAAGEDDGSDDAPLDLALICDWSEAELARAWNSGLLQGLPGQFWDDLVEAEAARDEEE